MSNSTPPTVTIEDLEWREKVSMAILEVFQTTFNMSMEQLDASLFNGKEGDRMVASVGLAGAVMGVLYIDVPMNLAQSLAATMLGPECDTANDASLVRDVIGEISNMVGGQLKSYLSDHGLPCVLSIPSITRGTDFQIEPMSHTKRERFVFRQKGSEVIMVIYVDVKLG